MSLWSRVANVFRGDRVSREIDEEMQSHIEEAIANGRDPAEARRAFGNALQLREDSRDIRIAAWLDSLRADAVFGGRQLARNKMTAGAAILSLALAIGACTAAFRLIDALLLRPLPISEPQRLHVLAYQIIDRSGKLDVGDSFEYPFFRALRSAIKDEAELLAISYPRRNQLTYGSDQDMERVNVQFVSGWMFRTFGLRPALGRLLSDADDAKPGAHPYAVLAYDYWNSRFGRDPKVVGRSFRMGNDLYQIVGVAPRTFTGTEPGTLTDIFVPTMMNAKAIDAPGWAWFRTWAYVHPGNSFEAVRDKLQAGFRHYRMQRSSEMASSGVPKDRIAQFVEAPLSLEPAAAGFSGLQKNYRRSLYILAAMVALVLVIACVNVANLMTAQATARAREMALRISIGAGRRRLVQLVLVESALIAGVSSVLGGLFAWWAAPFVVSLISAPDNPTRLVLDVDWRVTAFAVSLAVAVTLLFGLIPALRASSVQPVSALKGGEEVHSRHRIMSGLVAVQVAFCFVVHFVAGMFVATFDRLSNQPTGFSVNNLLILEAVSRKQQPIEAWNQITEHLKGAAGVESASLCVWPLMAHSAWSNAVWIGGRQMEQGPYFLSVSPEWLPTMRVQLMNGRGFRNADRAPDVAIVTEAFARQYLDGQNPVGRTFERLVDKKRVPTTIIGLARDVRYANMREAIRPVVFLPVNSADDKTLHPKDWGTFIIRTAGDPLSLAPALRQEIARIRPDFRVANIHTQQELVESHTVRERLLAMLSLFFATVALVLAGVGLYGVLSYSVLQRRREIGIRMALGAKPVDVARRVSKQVFGMLVTGSAAGLIAGMASEQYVQTLLYQVTARDANIVAVPAISILIVALLAAVPPVIRAIRIDPALALRAD